MSNWINVALLVVTALMAILAWQQTRIARAAQVDANHASHLAAEHEQGANEARLKAGAALSQIAEEMAAQADSDASWVLAHDRDDPSKWTVTNWTGQRVFAHLQFPESGEPSQLSHADLYGLMFESWLTPGQSVPFIWTQDHKERSQVQRVDVVWGVREGEARIARLRAKWPESERHE
ncbi:hypothetical protein [Frigoribacterium sp. PhB107]|uniref:hypothetical protein n=1 Tax=Frigoribacterium sp. PhB107 TaxID=2485172 RepID=UPI0011CE5504|nr:hypothetical protein [Frigoribacterium sp. PhB107]